MNHVSLSYFIYIKEPADTMDSVWMAGNGLNKKAGFGPDVTEVKIIEQEELILFLFGNSLQVVV